MTIFFNFLLIVLLVLMNSFFVAAEFSMVKVRNTRIETLIMEGNKKAKYVQKIISNLDEYLSACQLGITLASLGLGWIGEPAIAYALYPILKYFNFSPLIVHSVSVIVGFLFITAIHIIIGELAPKSLAIVKAERLALFTSRPLMVFYEVMYPIIWLFNETAILVLKPFNIHNINEHESAHTDEEIKILVEESYNQGLIDQVELNFVDNIFDFSETSIKEIMVPRTDMVCIYKSDTKDEISKTTTQERYTRYPVCLDDKDDIIGFVHIKDLYIMNVENMEFNIDKIIRPIISVPQSMSISVLLKKFQKEKEQMAIVIDEYGGTAGLVTAEDILEEIVGEIQDEFDDEEKEIEKIDENTYYFDGKTTIEDVNEILDIDIESDDYDTIGGWFYSQIELPPENNITVEYSGYEFVLVGFENLRITRLLAKVKKDS